MDVTDTVRTGRCNLEFLSKGWKFQVNIGTLASDFQGNLTDFMYYSPSNTSFSFSDNVAIENGF